MLSVSNISISSGNFQLNSISFEIPDAQCLSLMGPSGSGKTTIMEAICGLRKVHEGEILLDNHDITQLRPCDRNVALVPQDNALFPHLTVHEHLAFGPGLQKWETAQIQQRVEQLATELGILNLLDRKPNMLSGGESKRVALGRALATRPRLLCLDEALTGLDETTHAETLDCIKSSIEREKITTLHITHSQQEAKTLASIKLSIHDLIG
ncbi:ABC transporter ATP-binding protein [Rubritalea spongiae]|uniref:ABC transporter ATP-binding protein n=1 Tax=Rubritalea spongiae TaxID=430797 RepID=A0ABW5DXM2_9BACT